MENDLLEAARQAVRDELRRPLAEGFVDYDYSSTRGGVAVRFHTDRTERGCIAFYDGVDNLKAAVELAAVNAAFFDDRYPPLTRGELPDIDIEISLFDRGEPMIHAMDFVPGIHSLRIRGPGGHAIMQASLMTDNGWSKEEYLGAICRKAGLRRDAWRDPAYELVRYPTHTVTGKFDSR